LNKHTFARAVTGYVDPIDLDFEFGETSGPLKVYATAAELAAANTCVKHSIDGHDDTCLPRLVTITFTYEVEVDENGVPVRNNDLSELLGED
jgi:hypothetical protein